MSHPFIADNPFRAHDLALMKWLEGCTVDYGSFVKDGPLYNGVPIIVVMAAPDQAFAAFGQKLIQRGYISPGQDEADTERKIKAANITELPLISVYQTGMPEDKELAGGAKRIEQSSFDYGTGSWSAVPWPTTYRLEYAVTLWSKSKYTMQHLLSWFETQFNQRGAGQQEFFLPVEHAAPVGTVPQSLKRYSVSDFSEFEGYGRRMIRKQMSLSLRAMVYQKSTLTSGTIAGGKADGNGPIDLEISRLDGVEVAERLETTPNPPPAYPSANHFRDGRWPVTGGAAVNPVLVNGGRGGAHIALRVLTSSTDDAAVIVKGPATPLSVVLWRATTRSDGSAGSNLTFTEAALDSLSGGTAAQYTLASSDWVRGTCAVLLNQPVFGVTVSGKGADCKTDLADVGCYTYVPSAQISPNSITTDSLSITATWSGLPNTPHFLCVGGLAGFPDQLRIFAVDDTRPTDTTAANQVLYDPVNRPSAVIPFVPRSGGLTILKIVSSTTLPPTPLILFAFPYRVPR